MNRFRTTHNSLDYPSMIDQAMRNVVREALAQAAQSGLPGDHHFFVSYLTQYPGVQMSPMLRQRYPEEITIVVQHQYWDLKVYEDAFTITLSFNNVPEKLYVPFAALTAFADPSIKFGLQFHANRELSSEEVACPATGRTGHELPPQAAFDEEPPAEAAQPANDEKVISLEAFRKK